MTGNGHVRDVHLVDDPTPKKDTGIFRAKIRGVPQLQG
jgi:hypothetical protein